MYKKAWCTCRNHEKLLCCRSCCLRRPDCLSSLLINKWSRQPLKRHKADYGIVSALPVSTDVCPSCQCTIHPKYICLSCSYWGTRCSAEHLRHYDHPVEMTLSSAGRWSYDLPHPLASCSLFLAKYFKKNDNLARPRKLYALRERKVKVEQNRF